MEACGSAHHWARVIGSYGHEVKLMPPAYVKPYVKRNKNDGRDAEGICEAVGRPTMRFVPVKSVAQQATLAVHGVRALLVRQRTMAANGLRAALSELGIVAAQGVEGLRALMARLEAPGEEIPEMMRGALLALVRQWQALDAEERVLERQITKAARCDREARRLMEVPSVGPIIASTVLAKVPDAKVFRSGRDFAAWVGLTGRDHGTGGKHRPGRISKQGDRVLRALLDQRSKFPSAGSRRRAASPIHGCAICSRGGPTRLPWWHSPPKPRASSGPCWSKENRTATARARRLLPSRRATAAALALIPIGRATMV